MLTDPMADDFRLQWIQRNRVKRERVQHVGAALGRLARELLSTETDRTAKIVRRINTVVDAEFCRHCRILVTREGRLLVNVDEPGLVYTMRLRWAALLGRSLGGMLPGVRQGRLMFVHGRAGVSLAGSDGCRK